MERVDYPVFIEWFKNKRRKSEGLIMERIGTKICLFHGDYPFEFESLYQKAISFSPFKIHDFIKIQGKEGKIVNIYPIYYTERFVDLSDTPSEVKSRYEDKDEISLEEAKKIGVLWSKVFIDLDKFQYDIQTKEGTLISKVPLSKISLIDVPKKKEESFDDKKYNNLIDKLYNLHQSKNLNKDIIKQEFLNENIKLDDSEINLILDEFLSLEKVESKETSKINPIHIKPEEKITVEKKKIEGRDLRKHFLNEYLKKQDSEPLRRMSKSLESNVSDKPLEIGNIVYKKGSQYLWEIIGIDKNENGQVSYRIKSGSQIIRVWEQELRKTS